MPVEPSHRRSLLAEILLAAYLLALVYGTLYPWTGWRSIGLSGFGFLFEPWPRYWTWFDVLVNVTVYAVPAGLAAVALRRRLGPAAAMLVAATIGSALSLGLESLQSFLPGRVPSRLDWIANTAGALLGACAGGAWPRNGGRHAAGWPRPSIDTPSAAIGLALLAAWLAIQVHPQRLLFGSGDIVDPLVRMLLQAVESPAGPEAAVPLAGSASGLVAAIRIDTDYAVLAEAVGAACAMLAIGMLVRELFPPSAPRAAITGATILAAAIVKSAAGLMLLGSAKTLAWLSAGAQGGLVTGAVALALLASAGRRSRLLICIAALLGTVVLSSTYPVDAYYESMLEGWDQGAWRNFNGLLRGAAMLWPFAAGAWCLSRLRALGRGAGTIIARRP